MHIAIMQPYLFPYIGYWQLIHAADKFVIYDDVNYIKRGWINRNKIIINEQPKLITLPIDKSSQNKKINNLYFKQEHTEKHLKSISMAYKKAEFYNKTYGLLDRIYNYKNLNISDFLYNLISKVCNHINITTEIVRSSDINMDTKIQSQNKIIHICKILNATHYINSIGGSSLYCKNKFKENNIQLIFLKPSNDAVEFSKRGYKNILSIIDTLMHKSPYEIHSLLNKYETL